MIEFPKSCLREKGNIISQKDLLANKVPSGIVKKLSQVRLTASLSPADLPLVVTKDVPLVNVLTVALKDDKCSPADRLLVMDALDTAIPSPLLFVFASGGVPVAVGGCAKPAGRSPMGGDKLAWRYAQATGPIDFPQGHLSIEALLVALLARMGNLALRPTESLRAFGERFYDARKLRDELSRVKRQIRAEKQTNRIYELAKAKRELESKLKEMEGFGR